MEKKKVVVIVLFSIFILIASIYVMMNRDTLFESKATIYYPKGCVEEYVNRELVTPKCEEQIKYDWIVD